MIKIITDHFPLGRIFSKGMYKLSQRLWNVRSRLMDYNIKVCWIPGKQHLAAGALGRNPVWHGTAENNEEVSNDSGVEDACFIAEEYREERLFKDEFSDPMLEELFSTAKNDQAYQKVLCEVRKCLTKDALKLLHPEHPARVLSQQWEIGVMERKEEGPFGVSRFQNLGAQSCKEKDKGVPALAPPGAATHLPGCCSPLLLAQRHEGGNIQADGSLSDVCHLLILQANGGGGRGEVPTPSAHGSCCDRLI